MLADHYLGDDSIVFLNKGEKFDLADYSMEAKIIFNATINPQKTSVY